MNRRRGGKSTEEDEEEHGLRGFSAMLTNLVINERLYLVLTQSLINNINFQQSCNFTERFNLCRRQITIYCCAVAARVNSY